MKRIAGVMAAALVIAFSTAAYAQAPAPAVSGTVQASPMLPSSIAPQVSRSPPVLFWIGDLPVRMWAPVQPEYDPAANRNGAANPSWGVP